MPTKTRRLVEPRLSGPDRKHRMEKVSYTLLGSLARIIGAPVPVPLTPDAQVVLNLAHLHMFRPQPTIRQRIT